MKRILLLMLVPAALQAQLIPQKYITFGAGFSESLYDSKDFDRFKNEYNSIFNNRLAKPFDGFDAAEGIRVEVGYRKLARWGYGVLAGAHFHSSRDGADFFNGDSRALELKMNELFVEYQIGRTWNNVFVNAVCAFSFNRSFSLKSDYIVAVDTAATDRVLTGTYKAAKSISTDLGIAFGVLKLPMIISAKISYPVYTGGNKKIFKDNDPGKVARGFEKFPAEYENFLFGEDYKGITSDIEGLKILVTAAFVVRLR
jgi:hypothetical protein